MITSLGIGCSIGLAMRLEMTRDVILVLKFLVKELESFQKAASARISRRT